MGLDVDYIAAKNAMDELKNIVSDMQHGEREEIADDIIEFVEKIKCFFKKA
jgi:hypothetical protein